MPSRNATAGFRLDDWELDLHRREVRGRGIAVPLGGRAFEILQALVESAGDLVTKDDLMARIWPGAVVEDNTLQVHISAIRKALGADRGLLRTASGRGYRLLGNWTIRTASQAREPAEPAPARIQPTRKSLPAVQLDLIGRSDAALQLQDLLSAYRLVTLTGPGGIGKTSLAMQVAQSLRPDLDGVLVELASLADPGLLPTTVAGAIGLALHGNEASPATIADALGNARLLLVLDNCEHVVDAAAQMAEAIVRYCPNVSIIATSRELLRIDGEYVYHVRPLDVPPEHTLTSDRILKHSAVQLFIARANAFGSGFAPGPENLEAIVGICRSLDGMPLAIEFAAARAATLGVHEVMKRLDDRLALLTSGRRTALPRHRTLRAALDWSYGILEPREQLFLRRLGLFASGFTVESAGAAVGLAQASQSDVLDGIANLVAKSLINLDHQTTPTRWRLLETTRAYAVEKLQESGELAATARRFAGYFLALLDRESDIRLAPPSAERLRIHAPDIDNIRNGIDWALSSEADVALGVALTAAAAPLWLSMSLLVECRHRVQTALGHLTLSNPGERQTELKLYAALATALMSTTGRLAETGEVLHRTLQLAEELGDVDAQLQALWALWTYRFNNGENRVSEQIASKFLALAPRATFPADAFVGKRLMGATMHYRGRQPEAREYLQEVIDHYQTPGAAVEALRFHYHQRVLALAMFARVLWLQGFAEQAVHHARAAVAEADASGHVLSRCYALAEAACPIFLATGDLAKATRSIALLGTLSYDHGLGFWRQWSRCLEGVLLIEQGDPAGGVGVLREALDAYRTAGWAMRFPAFLGACASGLAMTGEAEKGLALIDEAIARAEHDEEAWCVAELLRIKGELMLQLAPLSASAPAVDLFHRALAAAHDQGALFWELRAAIGLHRLMERDGQPRDSRAILETVHNRFTEGFDTVDLRTARSLLQRGSGEGR